MSLYLCIVGDVRFTFRNVIVWCSNVSCTLNRYFFIVIVKSARKNVKGNGKVFYGMMLLICGFVCGIMSILENGFRTMHFTVIVLKLLQWAYWNE